MKIILFALFSSFLFPLINKQKKGECGYGPNVVKDGQILNNIKDRDAVLQVLSDSQ